MSRWPLLVGISLLLAPALVTQLPAQDKPGPEGGDKKAAAPAAPAGGTYKLAKQRFQIQVDLTGAFESDSTYPLALRPEAWSTFSVEKAVRHGARVKKGEPIVWLDTKQIDRQLEDLKFNRDLGKLSLQLGETELAALEQALPLDLKAAERAKQIADQDLQYFLEVDKPQREKSARFSLESAQHRLEYAEEELKQLEKMYKADDLTEETEEIVLKRTRNEVDAARFSMEQVKLSTEHALSTLLPRLEEQNMDAAKRAALEYEQAHVSLPNKLARKRIEQQKLSLENARADDQLAKLTADRELFIVRAPADGYVYYGRCVDGKWPEIATYERQLVPGGNLAPNQIFITIVSSDGLHVHAELPEKELYQVHSGITGTVSPIAFADLKFNASVAQVAAVPSAANTFDTTLHVDLAGDQKILPGMTCKIALTTYDKKDALCVPAGAVFSEEDDADKRFVYLARPGGEPEKRTVVAGRKTDKEVEILNGLREADEILLQKPAAK